MIIICSFKMSIAVIIVLVFYKSSKPNIYLGPVSYWVLVSDIIQMAPIFRHQSKLDGYGVR